GTGVNVVTVDCGSGSTGYHTLSITAQVTGLRLEGVTGRNAGAASVRGDRYGLYGAKTNYFSFANQVAAAASGGCITDANSKADMLIYGLFANDCAQAYNPDNAMENIQADLD